MGNSKSKLVAKNQKVNHEKQEQHFINITTDMYY